MKCTWKGCEGQGAHPQRGNDGKAWAMLCDAHNREIDEALDLGLAGDPTGAKKLLRAWVLASGDNPMTRPLVIPNP